MRTKRDNKKQTVIKQSNLFKYRYINFDNNTTTSWKFHSIYYHIFAFILIAIVAWAFYTHSSGIRFYNFNKTFKQILNILSFGNKNFETAGRASGEYTNLFVDSLKYLWITIKFALVGTFIGFLFALVTAYFSFAKTTNKITSTLLSFIILFLRSIPELVFIKLITGSVRNEFSLLFVYIWFTWLWLHKYYFEMLNSIDLEWYINSINHGNSKTRAFFKEIYPRIKNRIVALFIFSFESNIRWASILGALSLPGIGKLIYYASQTASNFDQLAVPLTVLMVFILILELLNYLFKKHLVEAKTKVIKQRNETKIQYYNRLTKKVNFNKWIIVSIFLFVFIVSIYTLSTTQLSLFDLSSLKEFLRDFFNPDFSKFSFLTKDANFNPILLFWNSFSFSLAAISLCFILTLFLIRVQCLSLNNRIKVMVFRSINVFIRLIPTIVYYYVFLSIFENDLTLLIIAIVLHQSSSQTKQLVEVIDNLDQEIIKNLKMQGYSNNQIFIRYVLPSIKVEYISLLTFYFELIFRSSITYSILTQGRLLIGTNIDRYLDPKFNDGIRTALAYVWLSTFYIIFINLISKLIIKTIKK
ncbi:PhnE/PtxC family ABC transporter permease [Mycoplasma sp. HU2014]|uniref:PhnE/PtxC family ABC transporter permease n=1 Tax=Mycoplasma sp. HU2014 TaxID=1664275 RepID=UPI00067BBCD1|nr:ABC transporter permease subunit [Mycoplasma sp. HU2014]KNG79746.1 ABC transporter permease [Mycoplasma sp. HU2014]